MWHTLKRQSFMTTEPL